MGVFENVGKRDRDGVNVSLPVCLTLSMSE